MASPSIGPNGVVSHEGVLSPLFYIPRNYANGYGSASGYDDATAGGVVNLRDHPSGGLNAMFHPQFEPYTAPDESIAWNQIRIFFRATRAGNSYTLENVTFVLASYFYSTGWTERGAQFSFNGMDSDRGPRFLLSPWITEWGNDVPGLGIKVKSTENSGSVVRIGAAYMQFRYNPGA